jgi:hypothetical protein
MLVIIIVIIHVTITKVVKIISEFKNFLVVTM